MFSPDNSSPVFYSAIITIVLRHDEKSMKSTKVSVDGGKLLTVRVLRSSRKMPKH